MTDTGMLRAFFFVTTRSFKNRIVSRLRKLREPRYLISFIAGLAYMWFFAFRKMARVRFTAGQVLVIPGNALFVDLFSLVALAVLVLAWAIPEDEGGLPFSEAEIQFLFPAPVSRRQLLAYKISREQPQIFISAVAMTFLGLRQGRFLGLWLAFVVMSVYLTMVRLARARLRLVGIGFLWRLVAVLAVVAAIAFAVYVDISHVDLSAMGRTLQVKGANRQFPDIPTPLHSAVVRALLFLPSLGVRAVIPGTIGELAIHCIVLLVLGMMLFELAARLNVSFEEASIAVAQEKNKQKSRMRDRRAGRAVMFRRVPPPFRIRPSAPPEVAIVWKNLIASIRISLAWVLFLGAMFLFLLLQTGAAGNRGVQMGSAIMMLFFCGAFPFLGSTMFTQDMRLDLPRFELLKSYPISGERLVAAEIAAPLILVSLIEIFLLSSTTLLLQFVTRATAKLAFFATPEFIVIALLFTIPICAMQLLLRNAVPVLLPGWATRSDEDAKGFAVFGQRLVVLAANLVVLAVAVLPAAILFVPAWLISRKYLAGPAVLAICTIPSVALLCVEVWIGVKFLGAQFEKIDVSTELDQVAV